MNGVTTVWWDWVRWCKGEECNDNALLDVLQLIMLLGKWSLRHPRPLWTTPTSGWHISNLSEAGVAVGDVLVCQVLNKSLLEAKGWSGLILPLLHILLHIFLNFYGDPSPLSLKSFLIILVSTPSFQPSCLPPSSIAFIVAVFTLFCLPWTPSRTPVASVTERTFHLKKILQDVIIKIITGP